MDRAASRGAPGVRLCQSTFHRRLLCLYTTLGLRTRERPGQPIGAYLACVLHGSTLSTNRATNLPRYHSGKLLRKLRIVDRLFGQLNYKGEDFDKGS
jgi:hypothetical protein